MRNPSFSGDTAEKNRRKQGKAMNISIAVADSDRDYIERLSEGLQQYEELTIRVYTSGEKLQAAMDSGHFDIVLFDPDISESKLIFANVGFPVYLYSDEARNRGIYADFAKVVKYQRISSIYKEIIREYADKAGYSADFDYSQNTSVTAVYSPAGGSGKTTMALALAGRLAALGKKVLFISAEQLNSSFYVNPKQEEGITALVEGAADEHVNFALKVKGIMKQGMNGMFYVEGFERIVDYDAVTGNEMGDALDKIRRCGICDVMVIDMESNLDVIGRVILELADHIAVVEKPGELAAMKMKLFAGQALMNEYGKKMSRICNFAENASVYCQELEIPTVGMVHNYGNLPLKSIIQSIHSNGEISVDRFL